jgi:hypothetical protein
MHEQNAIIWTMFPAEHVCCGLLSGARGAHRGLCYLSCYHGPNLLYSVTAAAIVQKGVHIHYTVDTVRSISFSPRWHQATDGTS